MKFFKLLTTTAITTMAVAAMAVSASAMTAEYSYDADKGVGTVALTGLPESATTQLTLLVLDQDATTVTEGMIKQIDQGTNTEIAAVKVADLSPDAANQTLLDTYNAALATYEADKTAEGAFATIGAAWNTLDAAWKAESAPYYVRVGGTQEAGQYVILADDFTVATTLTKPTKPVNEDQGGEEEPTGEKWRKGHVTRTGDAYDPDNWANGEDAYEILLYAAELIDFDDEQYELANITSDGWVDGEDSYATLLFAAELESDLDQYYPELFE